MYRKYFQRLRHQAFAVLFGILLISACTVSAGATIIDGSGDGKFFVGNSVVNGPLPYDSSLPYSYFFLLDSSVASLFGSSLLYVLTDSPIFYDDSSSSYYQPSSSFYSFYGYDSSFFLIESDEGDLYLDSSAIDSILCSSHDILDGSGSIVLTAQPPFSLNGYQFVFWDHFMGSNSLVSYNGAQYVKVSDLVPSTDLDGNIFFRRPSIPRFNRYFSSPVTVTPGIIDSTLMPHLVDISNTKILISYDSSYLPPGLYFRQDTLAECLIYIFDSSFVPSLPDFSQTTLTASNPQYDYQSAEFDVSWSNLPEIPYPDNVQYFIQGRLNDGAASQPPEIYLGSSSDPPTSDVPVSFSFSGLQPETQYTATFELVYNTTGSFRDFTRSGVTTSVSFTTLSDGSISEGDKAIINAIQQGNKDNQQWTDSQFGSAVGDLPQDTTETDSLISGLDQQEEAYKDDAYDRFQELSSAFSGFDGSVGSGIGLAGTLFSRFFNALGSYKIIYTFPLLLGLAMVLIGRLGRSSIRMERESGDQFKIDGW